jgi:hypothetical protein
MEPPLPFVVAPEPIDKLPLLPTLAVPELKLSCPDTPVVPALNVLNVILPLDCVEPNPDDNLIAPPDRAVDWPAKTATLPPVSVSPAPTVTRMLPPLPFVDAPVPTDKLPLLPTLAVPELKLNLPETPALPLFMERTVIEPLDVDEPYPVRTETAPPE